MRFLRVLLIFVVGALLGTAFGFAAGIWFFPYIFPLEPVNHVLTQEETKVEVVAKGTFIHANPRDPIHWGKGSVSVYKNLVFLEQDFEVGPGPDYRVLLVPKSGIKTNGDVREVLSKSVDLGQIQAFKGGQRYPIPPNVNLADYQSVVIWCRQFGVLISPADLRK
ncbi:MAG: DM13 domain-containing protein [Xanthobacteraceae bacterium]|nr:DM13 domain-containing protein [Xanthobacteraceae bacterium]